MLLTKWQKSGNRIIGETQRAKVSQEPRVFNVAGGAQGDGLSRRVDTPQPLGLSNPQSLVLGCPSPHSVLNTVV